MKSSHKWTKVGLVLHVIFALAVINQLISSLGLGAGISHYFFYFHVTGGITAFTAVILYLIYKLACFGPASLFPWNKAGIKNIKQDFRCLFIDRKLPVRDAGGLANFIQGLGVLLVLFVGFFGLSWFLTAKLDFLGLQSHAGFFIGIHTDFAFLAWWYLGGHAGMAFLHKISPAKWQKKLG